VQRGLLLIPAASIRPAVLGGALRVRRRPVLAAAIGLTVLGAALWVLVGLEVWEITDMVAPQHEVCLAVAAGTAAALAGICWSTWARKRAERERDQVLLKTLSAVVRPHRDTGPQTPPPLRAVSSR
jgi:hypothetical protein